MGVLRPVIVLPEAEMADASLRFALLHELCHIRRCDCLWKHLAALAALLHWFNPVHGCCSRCSTVIWRFPAICRCCAGVLVTTAQNTPISCLILQHRHSPLLLWQTISVKLLWKKGFK